MRELNWKISRILKAKKNSHFIVNFRKKEFMYKKRMMIEILLLAKEQLFFLCLMAKMISKLTIAGDKSNY
jgi:hypothetical protein